VAALKMMKEKYPSVNISLNQVPSSKSVYQIQNGELDCAVIYEHSSTLAENLKTRRLTKTCRCAVVSGDSPLAQKETLTLSDIEGEAVIFMKSSELITYRQFCDYRTRLGISTKNDSFVENMSEMALQIELTGGIGITGLYNQYGRDEKIKFIPIKDLNGEENETYLALAWREGDKNPIISTFCDILSQQIENQ
jgi:DNA-binding transcriptional LysR family regulator